METVTVSSDFQIEIPQSMRESLGIQPGQKFQIFLYDDRIELIPVKSIKQMRGFLEGIDTSVEREFAASENHSLKEVMDEIGKKAEERGMTPERLESILDEE
jgi:AbrB family looped-hinge helix DNA binding protein